MFSSLVQASLRFKRRLKCLQDGRCFLANNPTGSAASTQGEVFAVSSSCLAGICGEFVQESSKWMKVNKRVRDAILGHSGQSESGPSKSRFRPMLFNLKTKIALKS